MMNVAVIGVGGVGSWAACAISSYAEQNRLPLSLTLVDGDLVEPHNVARMFGSNMRGVGLNKAAMMCDALRLRGGAFTAVRPHARHFTPDDVVLLTDVQVIVCATDTVEIQRWLHQYCSREGKMYIRAGYDGETINVTQQFPMTFEDEETEKADAGYHETPTAIPAMLAGALAAYKVWQAEKGPAVLGEISKLHITDSTFVPEDVEQIILKDGWRDLAAENNFHGPDACRTPEGYHAYDECNHDDCIPDDYHRASPENCCYTAEAEGWHEPSVETCAEYLSEKLPSREISKLVEDAHTHHSTVKAWCGFCQAAESEDA